MKMFSRVLLALFLFLAGAQLAFAQAITTTVPAARQTTNASSSIAVTNTFQDIWSAQASRVNCGIQNNGTNTMWVFNGLAAAATKNSSVILAPGQYYNCATSGVVATSALSITGTSGDVYYAGLDGAPIVSAPQTVSAISSVTGGATIYANRANGSDAVSNSGILGRFSDSAGNFSFLGTAPWLYNGVSWDRMRGDTNGVYTQGNVASGAADTGNPVKIGCVYALSPPVSSDGQRANLLCNNVGALSVSIGSALTFAAIVTSGDAQTNSNNGLVSVDRNQLYNGSTWDREFTCPNSAVINVTAAATTELVALTASQVIRVCSFVLTESLAGTAKFVYGTGANCGTGTTDLTGAMALATNASLAISAANGSLLRTASANALCLTAVTGNITGFVSYAKY